MGTVATQFGAREEKLLEQAGGGGRRPSEAGGGANRAPRPKEWVGTAWNQVRFASRWISLLVFLAATVVGALAQTRTVRVKLNLNDTVGLMEIYRYSLAQGGQSEQPMWLDRTAEIRALRLKMIRIFVQDYFDLLPAPNRYNWQKLDETVDMVRKAGAEPEMDLVFKPKLLYPKIDPKVMDPTSWEEWEKLVYNLVRHYKERGSGIRYWEIGDECEIGENGGCPYECTAENYPVYYRHTVEAVLRADPEARVGGPTLADCHSPVLPGLLAYCQAQKVPLHFISWHLYDNDVQRFRDSIEYVKGVVAKYPGVHPELFFDEWNMSLGNPPLDPQFQPCFLMEVTYQMKEGGVDFSGYYQIRDYQVEPEVFAQFMTPRGTAMMTRWWNRMLQVDGLFDYQNRVRPSYFAFKLLSRLTGERLGLKSSDPGVHGLASWDPKLQLYNVLLWNFSPTPAQVDLTVEGAPSDLALRQVVLDASTPSDDENVRLRPLPERDLKRGETRIGVDLGSYGVRFLSLEKPLY